MLPAGSVLIKLLPADLYNRTYPRGGNAMLLTRNIMVLMRDGIHLATDLYLPEGAGPFPVLVNRTPYNKEGMEGSLEIQAYVDAGYAVVIQDVRGRYHSEGLFEPHQREIEDGEDCLAWVRQQQFCNGHLGMFGRSYHAGTQWYAAMTSPEGLDALIPIVSFDDEYSGSSYQNGAKVLHDLRWTVANIIPDIMERAKAAGEEVTLSAPEVYNCLDQIPLASDPAVEQYAKYYVDWMKHDTYDEYWKRIAPKEAYDKVLVPTLNISGWYDIFVSATPRNYRGMRDHGGTEAARKNSRLIMGPWTHMDFSGKLNGFDFGPEAGEDAIDLTGIMVNWFDHWLKGQGRTDDPEKPVKIFVMGENKWRDETDWPLPDTTYIPYYLHSSGNAKLENGRLSMDLPGDEKADSFIYDPLNPVPTVGGQVILPGEGAIGPRDQQKVEQREDVLVFETEELKENLTVIGPLTARLYISSDCADTDFTAKLTDVSPDGTSMLLSDGILRVRYRNSPDLSETELMKPGNIYPIEIDVMNTANTFLPGHKARLSISSSNFPRFNRNSNSGGDIAFESIEQYRKAENMVYHDTEHPSCLILPVIRR